METKLIVLRFTLSPKRIPPRIKKFSDGLDTKEGPALYKDRKPSDSNRVYSGPLPNQSLDEFLSKMEETHKFVIAWYEQRPDPNDPEKIYHHCVYLFAEEEDAKTYFRFAPVRPRIRAELGELIAGHTFTVRRFDDNPYLDADGNEVKGLRRWEVNLSACQPVVSGRPKQQLSFQGGVLAKA